MINLLKKCLKLNKKLQNKGEAAVPNVGKAYQDIYMGAIDGVEEEGGLDTVFDEKDKFD